LGEVQQLLTVKTYDIKSISQGLVHTVFQWGDLRETKHLEDLCIHRRIILKWIFKRWDGEAWTGSSGLGQGQVLGACECGTEPLGSMKCRKFLD
jgi:hypothetical protein